MDQLLPDPQFQANLCQEELGNEKMEVPQDEILNKIRVIRSRKVMLDSDLSELNQVETKHLKRQVRRNIDRFPPDVMFELTAEEVQILRSQIGTSSWGGTRYLPLAFTEQGVAMLSSVLGSKVATAVNVEMIRTFTKMREMLLSHRELLKYLEVIERKVSGQEIKIKQIFNYLEKFTEKEQKPRKNIGFKRPST